MKDTIIQKVEKWLKETLGEAGDVSFNENLNFGDISTNVALSKNNPPKAAEEIIEKLNKNLPDFVSDISIAGPGFINFSLSDKFLFSNDPSLKKEGTKETVIVEYTDPNPFKEFHIGHLMSNAIGEAIAGLQEAAGAKISRACYQGDVGMHVAKALWNGNYAEGSKAYEEDEKARAEIQEINKKVYGKSDPEINKKYEEGKARSLEVFDEVYEKLGTKFNYFFFESESGPKGLRLVKENTPKVFEESDGAVVYKGENRDKKLHTRVFINKDGLPTYEAKELGLLQLKKEKEPKIDKSIVITGNEVNEYFKVVMSAAKEIDEIKDLAEKTHHIGHGMLRLPTGKMSSRTGDVVTAESLIQNVADEAKKIIEKSDRATSDGLSEKVAVGAIKFTIIRQHPGKDIIFDVNKSISFEGDSGPYLMYTHARANSLLEKGDEAEIKPLAIKEFFGSKDLLRLLARFDDVIMRAANEYSPNLLVEYLLKIAGEFNSWYAKEQIVGEDKNASSQKLYIVKEFKNVLAEGLKILAIPAPEKM